MSAETDGRDERLLTGYSGRVFIVIAIGTLVANLGRQALPPLLPAIIDGLAISPAAAGFALTVMRIAFAVFQYPSGRAADRLSRKTAIVFGLVVMVGGFALLTQVWVYPLFLLATALLGIGSAFFFVAERVLLSDLFVAKRGRAFGANSAISRIGSIAAAGLAVVALSMGAWQLAFLPVVVLLLAIVVLFHVTSRESYTVGWVDTNIRETIRRVFGDRHVRWLVVAYTLVIFVWEGTLSFLPAFLQATKGFSPAFASGGFATLFAVGIVVQPLSGTISDRWDRRLVGGLATLVSLLGLGLLILAPSVPLIWAGILVYAAGFMAFPPVLQAYLMDIFPDTNKGGDLGAFKTVYEGLSSIGPTYVGVIAGFASYTLAFSGFLLCLLASAGVLIWLSAVD
ncbi:MAG: MFS transporter [Halobacteriales archaeon]|nr:MFS transporter [Halobacteriales archaeon]